MNQADVKVSFYLKKSEADAKGNCPVMARLNVGKYSEAAFSVKMSVPHTMWHSGRATGKSVAAREINRQLDEIRASALHIYQEQSAIREGVSAEDVKCLLLGMASRQQTLMSYFRAFIKNFEKRVGVNRVAGSLRAYKYAYMHVEKFLNEKYKLPDIPFTALDRSFIEKYDLHLRTDCHLALGTIVHLTTSFRTIINEAVADGILTFNPFWGYEPERPQREQKYLTAEELELIMTTPLHNARLYIVRDLFLFSCYTGISYGDMCMLTKEDLVTDENGTLWIRTSRKKTKVEYEVPLLEVPLHILNKYRDVEPNGKLLPMYSNSDVNLSLKKIAAICGINRRIVFHKARHNFGTHITLSLGVPIETVSKMMGHTSITTTQIYAHVTDKKVDEDMKRLREVTADKKIELADEGLKFERCIKWKRTTV